jgi:uncharacterized protein YgiM (DUF1202 family)
MSLRRRMMATVVAATLAGGGMLAMTGAANAAVGTSPALHASPAPHRPAARTYNYKVVGIRKGHYLAVRSGTDSHARIIGSLQSGATTTSTGKSSHGYLQVTAANGNTGWALASNLQEI